jgi:putative cardiolipin synthase
MQAATRRRLRRCCAAVLGAAVLALLLFGVGRATGELPAAPAGGPPHAWDRPLESALGRELAREVELGADESAFLLLATGPDALAARLAMIDAAERAIDFQYYMLVRDGAGELVVGRLLAAADRGVRVRVLLDDFGSGGLDAWMPELDAHAQIEVRYFNAFARGPLGGLNRLADLLARMSRLDHRMHNKLLAVDGAAAVVGGRNVGDEYYGLGSAVNFADADLLVCGRVVASLGRDFDAYWNSDVVCDVERWPRLRRDEAELAALRARLAAGAADPVAAQSGATLRADLESGARRWTVAEMLAGADSPEKVVAAGATEHLLDRIRRTMGGAREELLIVSPYFVPGHSGTAELVRLVEAGVRVAVLTNSLAATDVAAVHSGYARYRRALLAGGVELYELKPIGEDHDFNPLAGSSGASLHAKSFCQDGELVFVGSLNLDPRSVLINTEQGVVVRSRELAREFVEHFTLGTSPAMSWRVRLDGAGKLVWESVQGGRTTTRAGEPDASWARRWTALALGWLPLEGRL